MSEDAWRWALGALELLFMIHIMWLAMNVAWRALRGRL